MKQLRMKFASSSRREAEQRSNEEYRRRDRIAISLMEREGLNWDDAWSKAADLDTSQKQMAGAVK